MVDRASATDIRDLSNLVATLTERIARQHEDNERLGTQISDLRSDIEEMKAMVNRWKGGFLVVLALGTLVGFIITQWHNIVGIIKGSPA